MCKVFLFDDFCSIKKTPPFPAVFPSVPKGRKGEKEIGHSKLWCGHQSPEERECRRESEPLVPTDVFTSIIGFVPFDDLKYSTLKSIRQVFCQKNFLYCFCSWIPRKWYLLFCPDFWNKINFVSDDSFFWCITKRERKMTHEDVWRAIERFATEHGMSCSGLAKCSGLDPTTFNKSKRWSKEGQPRWPSTNSISKILSSTGAKIQDFTKFIDPPDAGRD